MFCVSSTSIDGVSASLLHGVDQMINRDACRSVEGNGVSTAMNNDRIWVCEHLVNTPLRRDSISLTWGNILKDDGSHKLLVGDASPFTHILVPLHYSPINIYLADSTTDSPLSVKVVNGTSTFIENRIIRHNL